MGKICSQEMIGCKLLILAALFITLAGFSSCKDSGEENTSIWGQDPDNAEKIYTPSVKGEDDGFEQIVESDTDGSRCVNTRHKTFAFTEHYCLYSPKGNLRLIAAGGSEACALYATIIDYDSIGRVSNVRMTELLPDEDYRMLGSADSGQNSVKIMKRWLSTAKSCAEYPIRRDSLDNIVSIGKVAVPGDYRAKYYIDEWGPFWTSDLHGGDIDFFIVLEKTKNIDGSYVNYMYCGNDLIAELAYWKGVFIKARTYNNKGVMVKQYNDRNIDLNHTTYDDFWTENPQWYVE